MATLIHSFCLNTTIKGVPRAHKANRRGLKILWAISVASFLSVALYLTINLAIEYFRYDFISSIQERTINVTSPDAYKLYPDITFCNLNPFSGNADNVTAHYGLPTLQEYARAVHEMGECNISDEQNSWMIHIIQNELLTSHGYYSTLGPKFAQRLSHRLEDFVVDCHVHLLHGFRALKAPCVRYLSLTRHKDYQFYNCYTFSLKQEALKYIVARTVVGMSVTLHLDNHFQSAHDWLSLQHDTGQQHGALVTLHERRSFPIVRRYGVQLLPGMVNDVKMRMATRSRLPEPWGICQQPCDGIRDTNWTYTQDACHSACLERAIVEQCGCRDLMSLNVLGDLFNNLSFCADASISCQEVLRQVDCARNARMTSLASCNALCPPECEQVEFYTDMAQSRWPPDPHHSVFYQTYITGRPYEARYRHLLHITEDDETARLRAERLIERLCACTYLPLPSSIYAHRGYP